MATPAIVTPQPLNGAEIKKGIAVRMTKDFPANEWEDMREKIFQGLGKTCTLVAGAAYAKFKGDWTMTRWTDSGITHMCWWVEGTLDDYGRITKFSMGDRRLTPPEGAVTVAGTIEYTPPDKFRRETDQPIPKPTELRNPESSTSTFSRSTRGPGRPRKV